jgi:hypothetical protein
MAGPITNNPENQRDGKHFDFEGLVKSNLGLAGSAFLAGTVLAFPAGRAKAMD